MTTYVERAQSMYERGDAARAAFMFANGLLRDPDNEDALNWLLMLYVEKIDKPGMERDILKVLETQPDGLELFELIETRLAERSCADKIEALRRMRTREGFLDEDAIEARRKAEQAQAQEKPTQHNGETSAHNHQPKTPEQDSTHDQPHQPLSTSKEQSEEQPQEKKLQVPTTKWSDGTDELAREREEDWESFEDPFEGESQGQRSEFRRTTATTGVYSSLNAISEETARDELRGYYAKKRKRQILIGVAVIAILSAVLLFVFPSQESNAPDKQQTATDSNHE